MASSFSIVAPDLWYYPYLRKFALLMVIEFLLLAFSLTWFGFVASRGKSTFFLHIFFCISMHWHKIRNFILVNLIYRAKRDVLEMISFLPYILINLIDIPKIPCQNIFKKWCCNNFFEGKNQLRQFNLQTKNSLPKKLL